MASFKLRDFKLKMKSELCTSVYAPGDLVFFNGIALFYQMTVSGGDLDDNSLGMILRKIPFTADVESSQDCQHVVDSEICIQEPEFVYTLLCKGCVVEVLDIDIVDVVEEKENGLGN